MNTLALAKNIPRQERKTLINRIEQQRRSRLLCYLTSDRQNAAGQIAKDAIPLFFKHLNGFDDHTQVDILVCTLGGGWPPSV